MAIVNGSFQLDPSEFQHPWTGGHHVDMRARPGRRTDLPEGVYASKFGSGVQAGSCVACKGILAGYGSLDAALAKGFRCGMYGQDREQLSACFRQARPGRR